MATSVRLHDYQKEVLSRLAEAWQGHRSVMLQMPTGTGKTHVLAAQLEEEFRAARGKRPGAGGGPDGAVVWIVAHRRELVAQIEETIGRHGIRRAGGRVRVMSIQWLSRHWGEMGERPSLVIIDEAHHAQANTYRALWEECPRARFLGLTATPCRMGGSGFAGLFEVLVSSWSVAEFIEKGRLSAFDYVSVRAGSLPQRWVDSLEKRGADGDYQVKEMDRVLNRRPGIERLYESVRRFAGGKKGIVYAIGTSHARRIAEYYSRQGLVAAAIDSRTPALERKRLVEAFKAGKIQVLVNVDVFSEGFDCPDVEFVQMARPTLSLAKYLQQAGRGLRRSEGKESCVLIDNVGLYRVFGLPSAAWDWEAMFRGEQPGKGRRAACRQGAPAPAGVQADVPARDDEMEVVVSHGELLSMLANRDAAPPAQPGKEAGLKAWQDGGTGLWGLQRGRRKVTEALFAAAPGLRDGVAAVKFADGSCGIVDAGGATVWRRDNILSMKFLRNHFMLIRTTDGKEHYLDLHSLRMYGKRPEVKRYGDVELLRVGHTYYSRTKEVYVNGQGIGSESISAYGFGITIFDYKAALSCGMQGAGREGCLPGYVCLLGGDHESYYRVHRWLADKTLVVADGQGRYYRVGGGRGKEYIGCDDPSADGGECMAKIERIAGQAAEAQRGMEAEKAERRQRLLQGAGEAVPFRAGTKWGLKVGGRVTVPPIYRHVMPPVGKYCAVEKDYSRWGVVALDGTPVVEPQYADIEISAQGTVTGTKTTGKKVSMKLP